MTPEQQLEIRRCVFRETNDAIFVVDPQTGEVLDVNPAAQRLTGLRRKELIGARFADIVSETGDAVERIPAACRHTSHATAFSGCHIDLPDGSQKHLHLSVCRIHTEPEPLGLVVARDLTRLHAEQERSWNLESRIQQLQRLESLGLMAGGVAHDFNNLLTGILTNAGLALADVPEGSPLRSVLEDIQRSSLRAADLTRQLLAYAGKERPALRVCNIGSLVTETVELLRPGIAARTKLHIDIGDDEVTADVDESQVRQVVMNLLANAAEAIGAGAGTIRIAVRAVDADEATLASPYINPTPAVGQYVEISIADDGCGMAENARSRIFDPFYTSKLTGRGLGLATALGIVRSHRGTIHVESAVDQGTTFRFLLPRSHDGTPQPGHAVAAETARRTLPIGNSARTILVVDDDEVVRRVVARALQAGGYRVVVAEGSPRGLDLFREEHAEIDLSLVDLTMPEMTGDQLTREFKKIDPAARVILTSGYSEQAVSDLVLNDRRIRFLQKPFRPSALIEAVENLLAE